MKTCTMCHREKPFSDFHRRARSSSGYAERCKECHGSITAAWYQENKERRRVQINARANDLRSRARDMKTERGCLCCQEREAVCLDWHHLDPAGKDWNPSDITARSWPAFLKEIEKCVVLCSNCHRKVHAGKLSIQGVA